MEEIFPVWDSLLKMLSSKQERFLALLVDEMAIHIISPSLMDVTIDTYREVITKEWQAGPQLDSSDLFAESKPLDTKTGIGDIGRS